MKVTSISRLDTEAVNDGSVDYFLVKKKVQRFRLLTWTYKYHKSKEISVQTNNYP